MRSGLAHQYRAMCARKSLQLAQTFSRVHCPLARPVTHAAGVHRPPRWQDLDRCCTRQQKEGVWTGPEPVGLISGQGDKGWLCCAPSALPSHSALFHSTLCLQFLIHWHLSSSSEERGARYLGPGSGRHEKVGALQTVEMADEWDLGSGCVEGRYCSSPRMGDGLVCIFL